MVALAKAGGAEGQWLRADRQTAGRGRQGRTWQSPSGNLHASTLVRLRPGDPPAASLALVAAVAVHEAVTAYLPHVPVMLKWPNDVLVDGGKVAGILLERNDDAVVVGIGINIADHPALPDRPTTSLAEHGVRISPDEVCAALADAFARWRDCWRSDGTALVVARWSQAAHPRGTPLEARLPDGSAVVGRFDGLNPDGALILRLADGATRVIHAADVFPA